MPNISGPACATIRVRCCGNTSCRTLPARCGVASNYPGWSEEELRGLAAPALLVIGDTDFVRIEHAAKMHRLIPDARLAVLPGCTHTDVVRQTGLILPMVEAFLAR